ncbi:MAG: hypothetical protein ACRBDX_10515 [Gammaproteobacteria bacterium]
MLILLQTLLYLVGALITGFLLIEGWLSQAVWVKGCSKGLLASVTEMESWAVKKHRSTEPTDYWGFMAFYGVALLFFLIILIF